MCGLRGGEVVSRIQTADWSDPTRAELRLFLPTTFRIAGRARDRREIGADLGARVEGGFNLPVLRSDRTQHPGEESRS